MSDVRTLLKKRPLLFDGGMGTYYKGAPGRECEQANRLDPEGIRAVHRAYLAAGADAIKTNTFGLPRMAAAQDPEGEALARRELMALYEDRDENFGNARDVRNLFEQAVARQSDRVARLEAPTREQLMALRPEDLAEPGDASSPQGAMEV